MASKTLIRMAAQKKYKYEPDLLLIDPALQVCPPASAKECYLDAFRWVSNPMVDRNFLPPGKLRPQRMNRPSGQSCGLLALSFHTTLSNSIQAFNALEKSFKNARRELGGHVARGQVAPQHGRCTPINRNGHFDLHEYTEIKLRPIFVLIKEIPEARHE